MRVSAQNVYEKPSVYRTLDGGVAVYLNILVEHFKLLRFW